MDAISFLLALEDSMSGPATAAESSLSKLESQINREHEALTKLEAKLDDAAAKLREMAAGKTDPKIVAAIDEQSMAVARLQGKLTEAQETFDIMKQARVTPEDMAEASIQVASYVAQLSAAKDKLAELQANQGTSVDIAAIGKQQKIVDGIQKESVARKNNLKILEESRPKFEKMATDSRAGLEGILGAAQSSGGALGAMAGKAQSLINAVGKYGVVGAVVIAALAVIALTAALVYGALAFSNYALKMADAARSARLLSDAAAASSRGGGKELEMVIDQIALKSPLARDKIAELGRALEIAGLSGRRMQVALDMITMLDAAIPGAGGKVQGLVENFQKLRRAVLTKQDLLGTGLVIEDVAKQLSKLTGIAEQDARTMMMRGTAAVDKVITAMQMAVEKKFGKTVAAQLLSITTQFEKLKENVGRLFADINIEGFLTALKTITDLFSQNTFTGLALKKVLTEAFNGIAAAAERVLPFVKGMIYGVIIAGMYMYLQIKKIGKALSEAIGDKAGSIDWIKTGMYAGMIATAALVVGVVLLFAVFSALVALFATAAVIIALPFLLAATPIIFLAVLIYKVITAFYKLGQLSLSSMGSNIVSGLTSGIESKAPSALAAITNLANGMKSALTTALDIHSPSRVFRAFGEFTSMGLSQGIDAGKADVDGSIEDLTEARPGSLVKSGSGGSRGNIQVSLTINIFGAKIDDDMISKIREAVHDVFEQEAASGVFA